MPSWTTPATRSRSAKVASDVLGGAGVLRKMQKMFFRTD
jgi:hypothetical protein